MKIYTNFILNKIKNDISLELPNNLRSNSHHRWLWNPFFGWPGISTTKTPMRSGMSRWPRLCCTSTVCWWSSGHTVDGWLIFPCGKTCFFFSAVFFGDLFSRCKINYFWCKDWLRLRQEDLIILVDSRWTMHVHWWHFRCLFCWIHYKKTKLFKRLLFGSYLCLPFFFRGNISFPKNYI